ncbi:MAG: hypothetical protein HQL95_13695 [Magnetococcales bacterium]|nr:hypothetical protein [Magnetococcales bacterium]
MSGIFCTGVESPAKSPFTRHSWKMYTNKINRLQSPFFDKNGFLQGAQGKRAFRSFQSGGLVVSGSLDLIRGLPTASICGLKDFPHECSIFKLFWIIGKGGDRMEANPLAGCCGDHFLNMGRGAVVQGSSHSWLDQMVLQSIKAGIADAFVQSFEGLNRNESVGHRADSFVAEMVMLCLVAIRQVLR